MKKILLLVLSIGLFSLSSCGENKEAGGTADLHFFYLELCPGCEDYETAERISASVIGLGGKALNIIHDEDAMTMKELLTGKNLADISHSLPILIVEDQYYVGYEEISDIVQSLEQDQ
jgi:hypothetical protein